MRKAIVNDYTAVRQVLCILWVAFSNGFQPIAARQTRIVYIERSRNEMKMHKTWRRGV
jgi:hypothetical protein